ncbi:MAG: penicillin-binding protein activator [Alphaproteobacteria bacterium]
MPELEPPSPTRVALLLPLTGPHAGLGEALLDAAQLALFDLAGDDLVLMPRDTRGTPEGAQRAAAEVIEEGAGLILGPLFATSVSAVGPRARASGVNVVAFSTDSSVAGQGVFIMGFLPRAEVERVVAFARAQGESRFAALVPNSPYGYAVVEELQRVAASRGAVVTRVEFYGPDAEAAAEVVRRLARYDQRRDALLRQKRELEGKDDEISRQALKRLEGLETIGEVDFDALMLADGGPGLLAVAPLLPYYDVDPAKVRMLGTGLWDDPAVLKEPALVGGWFAAPPPDTRADFEARYQATYGRPPARLATLAYDAMALAAVLARAEGGPDFSVPALTAAGGFAGRDGIFRFHADGGVERGLAVLEVAPEGFRTVSPAPESFAPPADERLYR